MYNKLIILFNYNLLFLLINKKYFKLLLTALYRLSINILTVHMFCISCLISYTQSASKPTQRMEAFIMNTTLKANVSRPEAVSRYLLSAALLAAVFISPTAVPSWIAIAACYPAFTALIQWDPVHAMGQGIIKHLSKSTQKLIFINSKTIRN